jgi:tRNA threonylcarbamoyladenosine biosynthesis protein TsaB
MTGILAVETATDACSVAVHVSGETRQRHSVAPRQHSALLFALLEELLPGGDLPGHGVEAIAFGSGPGSFTGLRIAASVAQGLAYSSRLPAVAIPTLAVLAQGALQSGEVTARDAVLTVLDARVNEVYGAVYSFEAGLAILLEGPWASPPGDIAPDFMEEMIAVGNGCHFLDRFSPELRSRITMGVADLLPCAADMIPLAQAQLAKGDILSPRDIQPVYVRDEIHWKKIGEQGRQT